MLVGLVQRMRASCVCLCSLSPDEHSMGVNFKVFWEDSDGIVRKKHTTMKRAEREKGKPVRDVGKNRRNETYVVYISNVCVVCPAAQKHTLSTLQKQVRAKDASGFSNYT